MNLCEEYIQRHNINIDYIKNVDWGTLFFKTDKQWKILTIDWKEADNHPGYYILRVLKPVHDGYYAGKYFDRSEEKVVNLEDYEDFIYNFIVGVQKCPTKEELETAAWEVALYIYDSLIAKYVSSYVWKESNEDEFKSFLYWLSEKVPDFGRFWESEIQRYLECHLDWLVNIIRKRNGTN